MNSHSLYTVEDKKREKELTRRAIEGESSAFGELYDVYQPKIYRFILLKVSHREEAEDLTHQVFLNAWKHLDQFRYEGLALSSWLFRIARNKVIDHYRTRKTIISLDVIPEDIELIAESSLMAQTSASLDIVRVYRHFIQLSPEQQEVLNLRFVQDLDYKEIAQIMGKNQGAIRVIQHRAIKRLQELLPD